MEPIQAVKTTNEKSEKITMDEKEVQSKKIVELPISSLVKFEGQPFKEYSEKKLEAMAEDIKKEGSVRQPIITRPYPDDPTKHQILSGHNRVAATEKAGFKKIQAIILTELDDEKAISYVTKTNFLQREKILPSEKARSFKMHMDILNRQGTRNDLKNKTSVQNGQKWDSRDIIAKEYGTSPTQVQRHICINNLTQEFLDEVDDGKIPLNAGVNISYFTNREQKRLYTLLKNECIKLSTSKSEKLKEAKKSNNGVELTKEAMLKILKEKETLLSSKVEMSAMKKLREILEEIKNERQFSKKELQNIFNTFTTALLTNNT